DEIARLGAIASVSTIANGRTIDSGRAIAGRRTIASLLASASGRARDLLLILDRLGWQHRQCLARRKWHPLRTFALLAASDVGSSKARASVCVRAAGRGSAWVSNWLVAEPCDGGTEMGLGGVPELDHERVPFERGLDAAALDAVAATVDQAYFAEAGGVCGGEVVVDDGHDVARREGMQVDR